MFKIEKDLAVVSNLSYSEPKPENSDVLSIKNINIRTKDRLIIRDASFSVKQNQVYGIIGPSGAGKTMLLRSINRLSDLFSGIEVSGDILYRGKSIFDKDVHPDALRSKIGMLLQQPVVFPKSIYENVLFGVKPQAIRAPKEWPDIAEKALREAALWDDLKDRLHESALQLSVGQQQRLCLARTLALEPDVILMDEPTSALDPKSTRAIEELIHRLKSKHTIVIITHNIDQAKNVTDWLSCVCVKNGAGEIVESARSETLIGHSSCQEVVEYLNIC